MTTYLEKLIAMREEMDAIIAAVSADGSGSSIIAVVGKSKASKKPKADKPVKKERANAGMPTLHGAWTKHVLAEHGTKSAEFLAWRGERVEMAKRGELLFNAKQAMVINGKAKAGDPMSEADALRAAHIPWVTYWEEQHADAYAEFKSAWEAANPKESRVASSKTSQASSSDNEGAEGEAKQPKKRGAKKHADMTPEELAVAKAKRAASKALRAAAKEAEEAEERQGACMEPASPHTSAAHSAAVGGSGSAAAPALPEVEEAEEAEEPELEAMPFTHKKINYFRLGCMGSDGEPEWDAPGDLWKVNADGTRGAYAGILLSNGKIDTSAEVMANAPEVE